VAELAADPLTGYRSISCGMVSYFIAILWVMFEMKMSIPLHGASHCDTHLVN
jgi:hypothetical protein